MFIKYKFRMADHIVCVDSISRMFPLTDDNGAFSYTQIVLNEVHDDGDGIEHVTIRCPHEPLVIMEAIQMAYDSGVACIDIDLNAGSAV